MSFVVGIAIGWGLAHVPAARWAWLEDRLKAGWSRLTSGKKVP